MRLNTIASFEQLGGLPWQHLPSGSNIVLKWDRPFVNNSNPQMRLIGKRLPPLVSLTKECELLDVELLAHSPGPARSRPAWSFPLGLCIVSRMFMHVKVFV
jgi:hypothetical protein